MEIIISALDQASEIFSQISESAQEMYDSITSGSDEASAGMEDVETTASGMGDEFQNTKENCFSNGLMS